jgi:hypothetical protein
MLILPIHYMGDLSTFYSLPQSLSSEVYSTPRLLMNFGTCKGDIHGPNVESLCRSKGRGCRQTMGMHLRVGRLGGNLIHWLAWVEKIILRLQMNHHKLCQQECFEKSIQNHTKISKTKVLGSILGNKWPAYTSARIFLPQNHATLPKQCWWGECLSPFTAGREFYNKIRQLHDISHVISKWRHQATLGASVMPAEFLQVCEWRQGWRMASAAIEGG